MTQHYLNRLHAAFNRYDFFYPIFLSLPLLVKLGQLDLIAIGSDTRTHVYKSYLLIDQITKLPPLLWGAWDWNWFCGYPFLKLYAPMFYYVVAFFSIIFNVTPEFVAYWVILLSYPLSSMTMYFLAKHLTKNRPASLVASVIYLYIPFHLSNGTQFGNPGSLLIFVFMPLALLFAEKFIETSEERFMMFSIFSLVATFLTNHAYALPFVVLFLGWFILRRKVLLALASMFITAFLSAFFIAPLLFYSSMANTFEPVHFKGDVVTSIVAMVQPAGMILGLALFVVTAVLLALKLKTNRKNSEIFSLRFRVNRNNLFVLSGLLVLSIIVYNVVVFFFPVWPLSSMAMARTVAPALVFLSLLFGSAFIAVVREKRRLIASIFIILFVSEGLLTTVFYPLPPEKYEKAFEYLKKNKEWFRVLFLPSEAVGALIPQYVKKPVLDGWFIQGLSPEMYQTWTYINERLLIDSYKALVIARYLGVKYVVIDTLDLVYGLQYSTDLYKALNFSRLANEVFADKGIKIFEIGDFKPLVASDKIQVISKLEDAYDAMENDSIFMISPNDRLNGLQLSNTTGKVGVELHNITQGAGDFSVYVSSNCSAFLLIPVSYSPNLSVRINSEEVIPMKVAPSFIGVKLPDKGEYTIEILVQTTSVDLYSISISSAVFIALLLWVLKRKLIHRKLRRSRNKVMCFK